MTDTFTPCVLIVDDDAAVRGMLRRVVAREGYQPVEAGSGLEAIEVLQHESEHVALIVLDLRMPVMDGFAFRAWQLAQPRLSMIPTVVVSGQRVSSEEQAQLRPTGFLAKPATLSQLQHVIRVHARPLGAPSTLAAAS